MCGIEPVKVLLPSLWRFYCTFENGNFFASFFSFWFFTYASSPFFPPLCTPSICWQSPRSLTHSLSLSLSLFTRSFWLHPKGAPSVRQSTSPIKKKAVVFRMEGGGLGIHYCEWSVTAQSVSPIGNTGGKLARCFRALMYEAHLGRLPLFSNYSLRAASRVPSDAGSLFFRSPPSLRPITQWTGVV